MTKRRAILIARVSNKSQARENAFSLEAQFRMMRAYCEQRGIEIVSERTEPGTSAFTPDLRRLPVLHQAVLDIEAGTADALVMHESSRLARNEQLANHLIDRLQDVGASFLNTVIDVDYTTPEGRMFFNSEASMNAYSSRKTAQHAKKGKLETFLQGLPVGAIPFGYVPQELPDGTTNRKVPPLPVPEEARLIERAFEDRSLGRSPGDIAREWNALGVKPRSRRGNDRFSKRTVAAIIENCFYMGEVVHLGERRQGQHEPIVSEDLWLAAQRPKQQITRRRFPPLLLQGLAVCAACERPVYPSRPRKGPKHPSEHYAYYREPSPDFNRDCPDSGLLWPSETPDALVDDLMRSLAMSDEWLAYVSTEAAKLPEDVLDRRMQLTATLKRLQKEYLAGRMEEQEYLALRREYDGELSLLPAARRDIVEPLKRLVSFGDLWDEAPAEARNDACRAVLERVVLDMRNQTIEVFPAQEFEGLFQLRHSLHVRDIRPGRDSR